MKKAEKPRAKGTAEAYYGGFCESNYLFAATGSIVSAKEPPSGARLNADFFQAVF